MTLYYYKNMNPIMTLLQDLLPNHKFNFFRQEQLFMSSLPFYFGLMIQVIYYEWIWTHAWLCTFVIYLLAPILDEIFKLDKINPS